MSSTPTGARRWLWVALALSAGVGGAYLSVAAAIGVGEGWSVMLRDAYLFHQYAAAWSAGHPYSFIAGDAPTTGSTSHLYPALLGLLHAAGARGDALSVAAGMLGFASLVASAALLWSIARRLAPEALPLAVLLCATSGHLATSLLGGTDAVVSVPLALGAFAAFLAGRSGWLAACAAALSLARPDGLVVALALLAVSFWPAPTPLPPRALRRAAAAGLAAGVAVLALDFALTGSVLFDSVQGKSLFRQHPPLGAAKLLAGAGVKLFVELVLGLGHEVRQMQLLPLLGAGLAACGLASRVGPARGFGVFWGLAGLGVLGLGLVSGESGIHRDRHLAWVLPVVLVYAAAGARAVSLRLGGPPLFAALAVLLCVHQLAGALYFAGSFAESSARTASSARFARQVGAMLPPGSRIGVASGAGMAYFLPGHHVTNVSGVVSRDFVHDEPSVVAAEILAARPELRFDYWLVRPGELAEAWYRPFVGRGLEVEPPEWSGGGVLGLFEADWSALERPASDDALARVEVGLPSSEAEHGYRVLGAGPALWIQPALVSGSLRGAPRSEVGRMVLRGERFRVPAPASGRGLLRLRTIQQIDTVLRHGSEVRSQRFTLPGPLRLELWIDGALAAQRDFELSNRPDEIQELELPFALPPERREGPIEVEVRGRYASLGWSLRDADPHAASLDAGEARVIWIVVDTLRRDSLGAYGHPADPTPAMDALARDGTRFDRAISSSGWTLPAMASLLTGTLPSVHKALGHRTRLTPISADVSTAAELLAGEGFRTLAVANAAFVSPYLGLARGFEVFDHRHAYNRRIRRAEASFERALALLDEDPEPPFFLLVHLFDPHLDYDPPPGWVERFAAAPRVPLPPVSKRASLALATEGGAPSPEDLAWLRALYEAEVAAVDAALGHFLGALAERGLYDGALIALTSDHGEEFWEHGGFEHGHSLHDELVRVPLIVKLPAGEAQQPEASAQVRVLDLLPTVLDLYGLPAPEQLNGRSLLGVMAGRERQARTVLSEGALYGPQLRSLRDERHVYTVELGGGPDRFESLYDWRDDPGETVDLIDSHPELAERARERYRGFLEAESEAIQATRVGPVLNMAPGQLDEVREALESLGYLEPDEPATD